jgi:hypothetical protein
MAAKGQTQKLKSQKKRMVTKKLKKKFFLVSLCCNSLAPARLAPAGLPSAFDSAAPRPAVCLWLIFIFILSDEIDGGFF